MPNVFIQEKLHKNGSLTISCVVNQSGSPSPLRNIIMGTGVTTLAKFKAEERQSYSYSRRQEYRPGQRGEQRGEVYSNRSLVSFVSVQFNHSECHHGRYWCDVTFLDMERFSWSLPALPRVLKEIRTCGDIYIYNPSYYIAQWVGDLLLFCRSVCSCLSVSMFVNNNYVRLSLLSVCTTPSLPASLFSSRCERGVCARACVST